MRRTENFRQENRRAYESEYRKYRAEDRREYGEGYRRAAGRADHENIYRELTKEGQRFCAVAGLLEEIFVLAVFGIRVSMSPLPVLAFLWVLFVILTAAALIGVSCLLDRLAVLRAAAEGRGRARSVKRMPVYSTESDRAAA